MKLTEAIEALRDASYRELRGKTRLGREELKLAFERAISSALAENTITA